MEEQSNSTHSGLVLGSSHEPFHGVSAMEPLVWCFAYIGAELFLRKPRVCSRDRITCPWCPNHANLRKGVWVLLC